MTTRVIGLDPGLANLGLVVLDSEEPGVLRHEHFEPTGQGVARLQQIQRWALGLPAADLVVLEGYAFGRANQAHQMGEARGALLLGLASHGYRVIDLSPSSLKQWLSGKGNLAPQLMPMRVLALWGWEAPSEHEAAAYALARFGEAVLAAEAVGVTTPFEEPGEWLERALWAARLPNLYQRDVLARWLMPPPARARAKKAAKAGRA